MDVTTLRKHLEENGQEHLLKFWEKLSAEEQTLLYSDLESFNIPDVNRFFERSAESAKHAGDKIDDHMKPVPRDIHGGVAQSTADQLQELRDEGLTQISEGRVAVLLLAGGQGTRLGVPYPKGMYNVGLPSKKSLYHLQAERILKIQELGEKLTGKSGCIPWYIMTSEATKEPTREYFEKNNYFGLKKENVILFEQHTLPCLNFLGKIILEKMHKVARAPDGNGGLYRALGTSNVLEDMDKRGIRYIHAYCVDNILVKMADPVFMGFCIGKGAECGAKVVKKASPNEAVGVVCQVDDHYKVVEYSEITKKTSEKRNPDGELTFNAGNICNHFFTLDFLKTIVREKDDELQHHVAKKKIPFTNDEGQTVKPTEPNGIKMEKFVFDVFCFTRNLAIWEVIREDEFSPLKNADGSPKDTPTTSRQSLYDLNRRQMVAAGGVLVHKDGSPVPTGNRDSTPDFKTCDMTNGHVNIRKDEEIVCEISPLVSYAGEGLEEYVKGKTFTCPVTLTRGTEGNIKIETKSMENGV